MYAYINCKSTRWPGAELSRFRNRHRRRRTDEQRPEEKRPAVKRTHKEELAWAAGIYEGEGCLSSRHSNRLHRRDRGLVLKLKMTDADVVRHFVRIVQPDGRVLGPYIKPNRKPVWIWQTGKYREVRRITNELRPWLFARRRKQIRAAFKRYRLWGGYKQ